MLETAKEIAREAGNIVMEYYQGEYEVNDKANHIGTEPVSAADIAAHEHITQRLKEEFPSFKIISEEDLPEEPDYSGKCWIVDPIDGTSSFINHSDGFCIHIGLIIDGDPELGVVHLPALNQTGYAQKRRGAFLEIGDVKKKLSIQDRRGLSSARIFQSRTIKEEIPNYPPGKPVEVLGGYGRNVIAMLQDEVDLHSTAYQLGKYDTCAPQVLLEEAGGVVLNKHGDELDYLSKNHRFQDWVFSGGEKLVKELIEYIKNHS